MGTGIVSILLNTLPYNARWLYWISVVFFALNVLLFAVFSVISLLRYALYPELIRPVLVHPVQSMYLGTFPMGLATLITMVCFVCVPAWGGWTRNFAWGLWIFDAVLSVIVALGTPFVLMTHGKDLHLAAMTAVWLLPIVSCVVASSAGAVVASILIDEQHALWTILASYCLWGIGVPLATMVIGIYLQRLTLYKLPPKAAIVSVFLPLGPLGQGSFGIMKLGSVANDVFPKTHSLDPSAGSVLYSACFLIGLLVWAFGLVWLFFAVASVIRCKTFPFNVGWWSFTFPLGVFATGTCQLGRELPSRFFNVLGTIFSLCVVIVWVVVSVGTIRGIVNGRLFHAPALEELEAEMKMERERESVT
ncbi:transporter [Aspergillus sp. HF37]|nr:transporter [Aspergillus sp. HF37]